MESKMNVILFTDEELNMLGGLLGQGVIQCNGISYEETSKMLNDFYNSPLSNSILEKLTFGCCVSGNEEDRKEWAKCYGRVQFGRKGDLV